MLWLTTPFDAAWDWMRGKMRDEGTPFGRAKNGRTVIFACPDCAMPIDTEMQKSNVRVVKNEDDVEIYVLSCCWCYRVFNIGICADVDKKFVIAKKGGMAYARKGTKDV